MYSTLLLYLNVSIGVLLRGVWALVTPFPDTSLQSGGVQGREGYTHSNYRVMLSLR